MFCRETNSVRKEKEKLGQVNSDKGHWDKIIKE